MGGKGKIFEETGQGEGRGEESKRMGDKYLENAVLFRWPPHAFVTVRLCTNTVPLLAFSLRIRRVDHS